LNKDSRKTKTTANKKSAIMDAKKVKAKKSLTTLLKQSGFVLPTTEEEISQYDKKFGTTNVILPEEIASPDFLFESKIKPIANEQVRDSKNKAKVISIGDKTSMATKTKENDYFKKLVLAAEIANQLHNESTFGHKKFVKVEYLCVQVCNMKLSLNHGKYAAGPLDPKHMYSVDAEFKKRKWFAVTKRSNGYGYKYSPGEKIEEYKKYYSNFYKSQLDSINRLINLFRKEDSNFCEKVATLYSVWKENLLNNRPISDDLLIAEFYQWSEGKKVFNHSELVKALDWMRNNEIVPVIV
jgi:hypothetical protein